MSITLGTFIRERRQDLGLTQEQLAERVGDTIRQSEISRLEHDRVSLPRRDRLEHLAAALDVSIGELLVQTGWMQEGDHLASNLQAATGENQTPDDLDAIALQNLSTLIATVGTVQVMVEEAALVLEDVEATMATLMRSLNAAGHPRSVNTPKIGIMDHWESMAVWI